MTNREIREKINKHHLWINKVPGGERAVFDGAEIIDADFSDANLSYASFVKTCIVNANFKNTTIIKADFSNSRIKNTDFSHTTAIHATFKNADILYTDYSYARLALANFCNSKLNWTSFHGAALSECDFLDAQMDNCSFSICSSGPGLDAHIDDAAADQLLFNVLSLIKKSKHTSATYKEKACHGF